MRESPTPVVSETGRSCRRRPVVVSVARLNELVARTWKERPSCSPIYEPVVAALTAPNGELPMPARGGIRATVDGGVLQILDNAVTLLVDEGNPRRGRTPTGRAP